MKAWLGVVVVAAGAVWVASELQQQGATTSQEVQAATGRPTVVDLGEPVPLRSGDQPEQAPVGGPEPSEPTFADRLREAERLVVQGRADEGLVRLAIARDEASSGADAARASLLMAPLTGDAAERRRLLSTALAERVVENEEYDQVGSWLRELNQQPGASLLPLLRSATYEVSPGDSLWTLCNRVFPERFGVRHEVGLVAVVNGLSSTNLRTGQRLLVPQDPMTIRVDTHEHGLMVFVGDVALCAYRVGLGRESRTPLGQFEVEVKQENPAWYRNGELVPFGHPDNVLGTRWMGFEAKPGASGFGIHGTTDPSSVGRSESMGCVRMRNEEVEELFEYVARGCSVLLL